MGLLAYLAAISSSLNEEMPLTSLTYTLSIAGYNSAISSGEIDINAIYTVLLQRFDTEGALFFYHFVNFIYNGLRLDRARRIGLRVAALAVAELSLRSKPALGSVPQEKDFFPFFEGKHSFEKVYSLSHLVEKCFFVKIVTRYSIEVCLI